MNHLYSNKLSFIDNHTFAGLHSLQELWLQINNLKTIGTIFSNFSNLKSLAITNNDLELIDPNCFQFLWNLSRIELNSNAISHITSLNIEHLAKLEEMSLVSNLLTQNFFINNTRMVKLNLSYNRMVEFRNRMFLPNLITFHVSNNRDTTQ